MPRALRIARHGSFGWRVRANPHASRTGSIQVSRVQYDGNSFGNPGVYPTIFSDPTVTGIQGSIFIDQFTSFPLTPVVNSLPLPPSGSSFITTSFSSKSEGSLQLSLDGNWLTYMGYNGADQIEGVSNSYDTDPTVQLSPNTPPNYDREVALIGANGLVSLTPESNAYSGDNPRGAITVGRPRVLHGGKLGFDAQQDYSGHWTRT